ncbi:hypothetical protein C8Q79DRAFT_919451 [Trametes meyenii]|nr:hypothetical protein C8Q79DRAFT_919451 [Trametes meyenii]
MPGHHRVRFADGPSTPSSTYSDSSFASSPGPYTPPALYAAPLPGKYYGASPSYYPVPLPQVDFHPVLVHTIGGIALSWDVTQPVESATIQTPSAQYPVTARVAAEPATTPPVSTITVVCEHLPWTITVVPRPDARWAAPYVTAGDVLHTLYRALRLAVTVAELNTVDAAHQQRIHDAYGVRWPRAARPDAREAERAKGIKRVDFLGDARVFRGLSLVPEGIPAKGLPPGAVWRLHVARP